MCAFSGHFFTLSKFVFPNLYRTCVGPTVYEANSRFTTSDSTSSFSSCHKRIDKIKTFCCFHFRMLPFGARRRKPDDEINTDLQENKDVGM